MVRFTGPLNFASADELSIPVETGVLDLSQVVSFDFVGLTNLAAAIKKLERISIVGCKEDLRKVLAAYLQIFL